MEELNTVSIETISKAMNGEEAAFSKIYKAYYKKVYFIAVQFFRDKEIAEDIVQEVFIKVYGQLKDLREPKAFGTWLQTVTYRTCLNYNRRKLKVITFSDYDRIENYVDLKQPTVEAQVTDELIKEIIINALENMKPSLKAVGILRFFEGMKVEEISTIIGIPEGTVGTRLMKIRQILQKALEKEGISMKQYGLSILSPAVIRQAYLLLSQKYSLNETTSTTILDTVLKSIGIKKSLLIPKIFLGGLSAVVIVSSVLFYNQFYSKNTLGANDGSIEQSVKTFDSQKETVKILDITYDDSWTNGLVTLHIETTNDNYDKIYVNGIELLKVLENGSYTIELIKDDIVIDQREISISNIDRDSPYGEGVKKDNQYVLYLLDDLSGVDQDSIKYIKNGVLSNDYLYDEVNQSIIIENDDVSIHNFSIDDYAGNRLNITIE